MNDRGSVGERVYRTLRDDIKCGFYAPGERIDATVAAMRLHTSVSPVRAALHRLNGERLVETHVHEGFSVPHLTEAILREQFEWDHQLVLLALRWPSLAPARRPLSEDGAGDDTVLAIEALITNIGRATPSADLRKELVNSNVRLHRARRIEVALVPELPDEVKNWRDVWLAGDTDQVVAYLRAKHERRRTLIPQIMERLHPAVGGDL